MCFQIDLRAETPVVPLRLRNLEAVTGEEDEGPSEGLVKPWGRFTEVRFNLFRGGSGVTQPIANVYGEIGLYQQVQKETHNGGAKDVEPHSEIKPTKCSGSRRRLTS